MADAPELNLANFRNDYTRGELHREDLNPNPIVQFESWFQQAVGAKLEEPNAMSLATVAADGQPSLRTVLLKKVDDRGFVFFTNLQSRKATEITRNPKVALLFAWIPLQRQVIVTGSAERVSAVENLAYFVTRPFGSQLAAWVSNQSKAISSRKALEMEWEHLKQKYSEGKVPLPPFWGGFRVKPTSIEFWQGRASRLHDRFMYRKDASDAWTIEQLAP